MIYYQKGELIFRDSVLSDAESLSSVLREEDKLEVLATGFESPYQALKSSFDRSDISITIVHNNEVIGMFGIVPESLMSDSATVWMLGSPGINKIKKTFVKLTRTFIDTFLTRYPILENWVDARYEKAISWLKTAGARFEAPQPWGPENYLFCHFVLRRDNDGRSSRRNRVRT